MSLAFTYRVYIQDISTLEKSEINNIAYVFISAILGVFTLSYTIYLIKSSASDKNMKDY